MTDTHAATISISARCKGKKLATNMYFPSLLRTADLGSRKTSTSLTTLFVARSTSITVLEN